MLTPVFPLTGTSLPLIFTTDGFPFTFVEGRPPLLTLLLVVVIGATTDLKNK
jgi:hypothetical protein